MSSPHAALPSPPHSDARHVQSHHSVYNILLTLLHFQQIPCRGIADRGMQLGVSRKKVQRQMVADQTLTTTRSRRYIGVMESWFRVRSEQWRIARAPQAPRPRGGGGAGLKGPARGPPGRSSRRKPLARGPHKLFAGGGPKIIATPLGQNQGSERLVVTRFVGNHLSLHVLSWNRARVRIWPSGTFSSPAHF